MRGGASGADPKVGTSRASKSKPRRKAKRKANKAIAEVSPLDRSPCYGAFGAFYDNTPPGSPPSFASSSDTRPHSPDHGTAQALSSNDCRIIANQERLERQEARDERARRSQAKASSSRGAVARVARAPVPGLLLTAVLLATCPGQTESLQLPRYSQVGLEASGLGSCSRPLWADEVSGLGSCSSPSWAGQFTNSCTATTDADASFPWIHYANSRLPQELLSCPDATAWTVCGEGQAVTRPEPFKKHTWPSPDAAAPYRDTEPAAVKAKQGKVYTRHLSLTQRPRPVAVKDGPRCQVPFMMMMNIMMKTFPSMSRLFSPLTLCRRSHLSFQCHTARGHALLCATHRNPLIFMTMLTMCWLPCLRSGQGP